MISKRRLLQLLLPLAVAPVLSACDNPYVVKLKRDFGWTEERMLRDGWLEPRKLAAEDSYCYGTLADPVCYAEPRPAEKDRLVGKSGHPPAD